MTLSELLEKKFRADLRFRGETYLRQERVTLTQIRSDSICGVVRDGGEYETQLRREDGELKMSCECPAGQRSDAACKHLWATIRAVEEENLVTGSLKPGYIPPFATEPEPLAFEEAPWDLDELADVPAHFGLSSAEREEREALRRLEPWEARLLELHNALANGEAVPTSDRDREIYYEIDCESSRDVGQLVVQTSQRQRRVNGEWGKLKPLRLRADQLDEIQSDEDRRILAFLSGGTPERSNWYAQHNEMQSSVYRYRLPYDLCELVLPRMCATGRVRLLETRPGRDTPALTWDDGPPWELCLAVVSDEDSEAWRFEGRLKRDSETMPVTRAALLLPGGLVVTETHIARLQDFGAFPWIELLRRSEPVEVPAGEEHDLLDRLLDMPAVPRLELPDELELERVECDPVPQLMIRSPRGPRRHWDRLFGEVSFDYLGTSLRACSTRWAVLQREPRRCVLRNRPREEEASRRLEQLGFRRVEDRRNGHDVAIASRELGPAVRALIAEGWKIQADDHDVRRPGELNFRVHSGIDWFELHGDVDFEGHSVAFPELLAALSRGDATVRLEDGSLGLLPDEWANQFGLLAGLGVADEDHLRFGSNQVALLDALLASQPSVDYDRKFGELREKFQTVSGIEPAGEPEGFQGTLRGYQREGLGWLEFLQELSLGGCLADDMGLGKTIQVLALLLDRSRQTDQDDAGEGNGSVHRPSLIVVPKSLLFNWKQECVRFTPQLDVLEYTGLERAELRKDFPEYDVILTTYGTLRRDAVVLKDTPFDYVVLDEAQAIKNANSQVAKAARLLQAEHRLALSGTPVENHLSDLWSIFEFLNPGMLGRSSAFKAYAAGADDEESRRLLSRVLRPFILRRTKRQVASELPEKLEQTIYCDMGREQRRLYGELRDHYRSSLLGLVQKQGLAKSKMHVLEALLRLRQAACHPALLDRTSEDESSAKLDVLRPFLEELLSEGHKALVFSQFTSMLAIVRKHLDRHGITYEYLDGKTRNRRERVERFQSDPDCNVFLISLKAGGLGLNLTAADYVFLLDPWWNPAVETQAIDRAHRVGQTRQVFAYRLICRNTVEEKIEELQNQKRSLAEAILAADKSLLRELSSEDLEMLLS